MTINLHGQPGDSIGALDSAGIGIFSSGTGGHGNGGGNGAGGHGNEGLGNGADAPPPGHDYNFNDGAGTSPGNPGASGGNGYLPANAAHVELLVDATALSGFETPVLVGVAGIWAAI